MGEYAKNKRGQSVKLGTCTDLYYCTMKQRHEVIRYNFHDCKLSFRLPLIPAYKADGTVDYECREAGDGTCYDWKFDYRTRIDNEKFWEIIKRDCPETIESNKGIIQLTHRMGVLINVDCFHGYREPKISGEARLANFNPPLSIMRVAALQTNGDDVNAVIRCPHCDQGWVCSMEELEELLESEELLAAIKEEVEDWKNNY